MSGGEIGHFSFWSSPQINLAAGWDVCRRKLPEVCRLGANEDAFLGGFRLWVDA